MRSNNIIKILKNVEKNNIRSTLIIGPWGCGKTYWIKQYIGDLEKAKQKKPIYISLFGIQTIDEINTKIINLSHKKIAGIKKAGSIISKVIAPIPRLKTLSDAIGCSISQINFTKIKRTTTIIFDDFDRLCDKLDWSDVLGYFNSLYMSGCKIVCFYTHSKSSEKQSQFEMFKEKVFDQIYEINDQNNEYTNNLIKQYYTDSSTNISSILGFNIRLYEKLNNFFATLLSETNIPQNQDQLNKLYLASAQAIKFIFSEFNVKTTSKMEENSLFTTIKDKLTLEIASKFIGENYHKHQNYLVILYLIEAFYLADFSDIKSYMMMPSQRKIPDILNKNIWLLDKKGMNKYKEGFIEYIKHDDVQWNNALSYNLSSILICEILHFSDDELKLIAKKIAPIYKYPNTLKWELNILKNDHSADTVVEKIEKYIENNNENKKKISVEETFKSKDYENMNDILYKAKMDKNLCDLILSIVNKHNYCLPDLSKELTEDEWRYCLEISKFIWNMNNEEQLLIYFEKSLPNTNDELVKLRLKTLKEILNTPKSKK